MEHKSIQTARGTVHYWTTSKRPHAPCIVFTHGLTSDHSMFEKQVEALSAQYTLLTWDVPLHGLSRPYTDFSFRHTAEDLWEILQQEQLSRVVLVGMSMGGYPSQEFIHRYPQHVSGFVALDTTPFGHAYYSALDLWCLRHIRQLSFPFSDCMIRQSMSKAIACTRYSYEKQYEILKRLTREDILTQMDTVYRMFVTENKDLTIPCPVLILLGDHDHVGKVPQYCRAWAQKTGYPLHIIQNASHFSNGDNPAQVNEEIVRFVEQLQA